MSFCIAPRVQFDEVQIAAAIDFLSQHNGTRFHTDDLKRSVRITAQGLEAIHDLIATLRSRGLIRRGGNTQNSDGFLLYLT